MFQKSQGIGILIMINVEGDTAGSARSYSLLAQLAALCSLVELVLHAVSASDRQSIRDGQITPPRSIDRRVPDGGWTNSSTRL